MTLDRKMHYKYLMAAGLLILASAEAPSESRRQFKCPEALAADAIRIDSGQHEWTPFVASPLYLHSAAPMHGPPEMRGDLANFTERRNKHEWSYSYRLEGAFPEGKWLQCAYGENNQVTLSRRLPDDVLSCTFTYRKGAKAGQNDIGIICR
jgi:hypothetical protein